MQVNLIKRNISCLDLYWDHLFFSSWIGDCLCPTLGMHMLQLQWLWGHVLVMKIASPA